MKLNEFGMQDTKLFAVNGKYKIEIVQSFLSRPTDIMLTIHEYICPDNRCTDFQMVLYRNI